MVLPISDDDSRRRRFPYVNLLLIGLNVLVYVYVYYLVDPATQNSIIDNYSLIPHEILQGQDVPPAGPSPLWITLITAMFLHGGLLHIGGNMLFLFIFGDNVEDAFGHIPYLVFYLACGVAAGLTQAMVAEAFEGAQGPFIPELGASGAIAGVLGAYIVLYPRAKVRAFVGIGILFFTRLSAGIVIGIWILMQFIPGLTTLHSSGAGVAYFAHIGGFVVGAVLALIVRPLRRQAATNPPAYPGPFR